VIFIALLRLGRRNPMDKQPEYIQVIRDVYYAETFALQEALYGLEDGDKEVFESGMAAYR
jgi:hypothetical protein